MSRLFCAAFCDSASSHCATIYHGPSTAFGSTGDHSCCGNMSFHTPHPPPHLCISTQAVHPRRAPSRCGGPHCCSHTCHEFSHIHTHYLTPPPHTHTHVHLHTGGAPAVGAVALRAPSLPGVCQEPLDRPSFSRCPGTLPATHAGAVVGGTCIISTQQAASGVGGLGRWGALSSTALGKLPAIHAGAAVGSTRIISNCAHVHTPHILHFAAMASLSPHVLRVFV